MDKETTSIDQVKHCWFIDLDWYQQNARSFSMLAHNHLCPKCSKRFKEQEVSAADLVSAITNCCSKKPGFITSELPILESIFRLFLANGNQPLDLEELGRQLSERRGGDTYRASVEILSRLLSSDQYYGLRPVP